MRVHIELFIFVSVLFISSVNIRSTTTCMQYRLKRCKQKCCDLFFHNGINSFPVGVFLHQVLTYLFLNKYIHIKYLNQAILPKHSHTHQDQILQIRLLDKRLIHQHTICNQPHKNPPVEMVCFEIVFQLIPPFFHN